MVCSGDVGAVYWIEDSRLARNARDWHHLIDFALAGAVVIDPDGAYDPRLVNDRLLLGLKGTMSEYELSLLRQRGIAARDSKARRGECRFMLPLASAGAKWARSKSTQTNMWSPRFGSSLPSSPRWLARVRSFFGCRRSTSKCPSSCAILMSTS
nr:MULTISPECIES: recombinase family protein [unclassified Bradyrhizobium]